MYRPTPDLTFRLRRRLAFASGAALFAAMIPISAFADDTTATQAAGVAADTIWVIVAACFVMFMQAGFAMLEVGFSRMKNVGTVVAKVVTNLSVSSIAYWGIGFGLAFGAGSSAATCDRNAASSTSAAWLLSAASSSEVSFLISVMSAST